MILLTERRPQFLGSYPELLVMAEMFRVAIERKRVWKSAKRMPSQSQAIGPSGEPGTVSNPTISPTSSHPFGLSTRRRHTVKDITDFLAVWRSAVPFSGMF